MTHPRLTKEVEKRCEIVEKRGGDFVSMSNKNFALIVVGYKTFSNILVVGPQGGLKYSLQCSDENIVALHEILGEYIEKRCDNGD